LGSPERVVVVGAGVAGLATALALGRAGHPVTLVDRDPLVVASDPEAAFAAERPGAPQVHHTHGLLARLMVELRRAFPDVVDQLMAAGGTTMSGMGNLGEPQPGDEDLAVVIVRRTTLDWVLRQAVLAEPTVEVRSGAAVAGLVADGGVPTAVVTEGAVPEVPRVTGVRLADGTVLEADMVVAANGRRAAVPAWLDVLGVTVPEIEHPSGLVYITRWYRLDPGFEFEIDARLFGDLGYVKYLGVPGDADTLSVTLAVWSSDSALRAALLRPGAFEAACAAVPGPDRFFGEEVEPLGPVRPMGGFVNRLRQFIDADGRPSVAGFHAVGDAHTCTNPIYGRGCALAMVQALALADAAATHPGDPLGRAVAYEATCAAEVEPWFHMSVQMDAAGSDPSAGGKAEGALDAEASIGFRKLMVASATDPVLGRGLAKLWHLLTTPAGLAADPEFGARAAAAMADPGIVIPPREGPTRDELLAAVAADAMSDVIEEGA
jgi:2-polyprenyl-6-methoxyphenol hydroxylase-like FAD-dependent oxidoreductase